MKKAAIKDLIYGGLEEILHNRSLYYHSSVGAGYSHLTDDGKAAIVEFIELMAWKVKEAEEEDLRVRSKELVMKTLKGE